MCDVSQKWVELLLDFTYDQVAADDDAVTLRGRRARNHEGQNGVTSRTLTGFREPWPAAYFDYWDGEVEPARTWQRSVL